MIMRLGTDDANWVLTVIAEGAIGFAEIRAHFLEERADGALGYHELIDARRATTDVSASEVRRIVDLVRSEGRSVSLGPTAVLVSSDVAVGMLRVLEMLVEDVAAIRPFRDRRDAVRWLANARGAQRGAGARGSGAVDCARARGAHARRRPAHLPGPAARRRTRAATGRPARRRDHDVVRLAPHRRPAPAAPRPGHRTRHAQRTHAVPHPRPT